MTMELRVGRKFPPTCRRHGTVGRLTSNRKRVLAEYAAMIAAGERVSWAELARRCGLHSYRDARRTISDLERFGRI